MADQDQGSDSDADLDHKPKLLNLTKLGIEAADEAAWKYWNEDATNDTAHLDRDYVEKLRYEWSQFLPSFKFVGKRVLDYGTGGGYVGEELFNRFQIGSYCGVDISNRSLEATKKTLHDFSSQVDLHLVPRKNASLLRFSELKPDVLVANAVIQHMPTVEYLEQFLKNVDDSQAVDVMLQFRKEGPPVPGSPAALEALARTQKGEKSEKNTTFASDAYTTAGGNPVLALFTTKEFLAARLPKYELMWTREVNMCCGTLGQFTGWKRKDTI